MLKGMTETALREGIREQGGFKAFSGGLDGHRRMPAAPSSLDLDSSPNGISKRH